MSIYSFDSSDSRYMFTVATDTTGKFLESVCIDPHSELPEYMTNRMPELSIWDSRTVFKPVINGTVIFGDETHDHLANAIPANADEMTVTEFWAGLDCARELATHLTDKFGEAEKSADISENLSFEDTPENPAVFTPHTYMMGKDKKTGKWGFWQILKVNPKTIKVAQCLTRYTAGGLVIPGCLNDLVPTRLVRKLEGSDSIANDTCLYLTMWDGHPAHFENPTLTESEYFSHV